MQRHVVYAAIAMQLFAASAATAQTGVPCPVTTPPASDGIRPAHDLWRHGSDEFGVFLPSDSRWHGMTAEHHYRNKVFWYREGYDGRLEPQPSLTVHGRRLDGPAPRVAIGGATNARHADSAGGRC